MRVTTFILVTLTMLFSSIAQLHAQNSYNFWVLLTDKANSPFSISEPQSFLSERAIQRRISQSINVDMKDIPVDPAYIQQVSALTGVQYKYASKWFNALVVICDSSLLPSISALPFVSQIRRAIPMHSDLKPVTEGHDFPSVMNEGFRLPINYGLSSNQIMDLNGQALHDQGFQGEGMVIAILDSGFDQADVMTAFEPVFSEGRVLSTFDFVDGDTEVYNEHNHGRYVFSTIAGIIPGLAYGTAVNASFHLLRTEDVDSETHVEEYNWIVAAEYADSAGADVLNTSLGYTEFDSLQVNYTYTDMDGNSTWITRGADIAASRGMLVVNSAGNSGNSSFHYISAPADGDSVLAVGSIQADSLHSGFSSFGPSFDGRVKPNVCAQGTQAIGINSADEVVTINGTSFSSPIVAGLATCLWQAVPGATNMQVFEAIQMSADHYQNPNDSLGYGIPNFGIALELLQELVGLQEIGISDFQVYPNPVNESFRIIIKEGIKFNELELIAWDMKGAKTNLSFNWSNDRVLEVNVINLEHGLYILKLRSNEFSKELRFIKE